LQWGLNNFGSVLLFYKLVQLLLFFAFTVHYLHKFEAWGPKASVKWPKRSVLFFCFKFTSFSPLLWYNQIAMQKTFRRSSMFSEQMKKAGDNG